MFSRFTVAAMIYGVILLSSIIHAVAQENIKDIPMQSQIDQSFYADKHSMMLVCDVNDTLDREYVINIHNPTQRSIKFDWQVATFNGRISEFEELKLDQSIVIDCKDKSL